MRKLIVAAAIAIFIEACVIFRLPHQNRIILSRADVLAEQLTEARKSAEARESGSSALGATIAELEDELKRATQALSITMTSNVEAPGRSTETNDPDPLGLTTNDVDLAGMFIAGTNRTLFVPLRGKASERLRVFVPRRQPLVFGKLLSGTWDGSSGYYALGRWMRDGTNVLGIALRFNSNAEAEAFASEMRAHVTQ